MTLAVLISFVGFIFALSITPGPNNLMLLASGANFGFRRTIPHMLGVTIGFTFMLVLVGCGIAQIFELYPVFRTVLKVASITYMLYLAWKIANAAAPKDAEISSVPLTFLQASAFQWVNPKAWTMALSIFSVYAPQINLPIITQIVLVDVIVGAVCVSTWAYAGEKLRTVLQNPQHLRNFNWTMAALLVASLYSVIKL